jgi:hypothetical protein
LKRFAALTNFKLKVRFQLLATIAFNIVELDYTANLDRLAGRQGDDLAGILRDNDLYWIRLIQIALTRCVASQYNDGNSNLQ